MVSFVSSPSVDVHPDVAPQILEHVECLNNLSNPPATYLTQFDTIDGNRIENVNNFDM